MTSAKNRLGKVIDGLFPDNQVEYIKFTRIKGSKFFDFLNDAENKNKSVKFQKGDITIVKLKVNPQTIRYRQPKIIQKIQTSSPARFTVFDWGNDLNQITISGCTGNLLPAEITNGFNPAKSVMNAASLVDIDASASMNLVNSAVGEIAPIYQNIMIGSMTYYELLALSPKYRAFQALRNMYSLADADSDIVTMETGETIHRGYFVDFSFEQTAENPWNWKYDISFTSINDLTSFFSRSDSDYTESLLKDK
jgi:hypothetical protein